MPDAKPPTIFRVRELELRYRPQRLDSPFTDQLSEPAAVAALAARLVRDCATEVVLTLHLNRRHRLVGVHRIQGTTDAVALSIADVLRVALLSTAPALVFVHSHISGDPQPSAADRELVQRLRDAVRMVGLELLDAVIVVDPQEGNQYFSFQKEGLL